MQGPEAARPWVEKAGATFPCLVDDADALSGLLGVTAVPLALFIDEEGILLEPPTAVEIRAPKIRDSIAEWAKGESRSPGTWRDMRRDDEGNPAVVESRAYLRLAKFALDESRKLDALSHLKKAWRLDPDNWLIHKQIWALEHPERFYAGDIDLEWQKEQIARESSAQGA